MSLKPRRERWVTACLWGNNRCQILLTSTKGVILPSTKMHWKGKKRVVILEHLPACSESVATQIKYQWMWAAKKVGMEVNLGIVAESGWKKKEGFARADEFKKLTATDTPPLTNDDLSYIDMDLLTSENMKLFALPLEDLEHLSDHDRLLKALSDCWSYKRVYLENIARDKKNLEEVDAKAESLFFEISKIWGVRGAISAKGGDGSISCIQSPEKRFSCETA